MVRLTFCLLSCVLYLPMASADSDPTRPQLGGVSAAAATGSSQRLVLSAIFNKGQHKSAIINGKLYRTGDRVGNSKLVKIGTREVILANDENRTRLVLIKKIKR